MVLAKYGVKEAQNRRNACFDWFREGDCKKIESLGEGRRSCVTGDGRGDREGKHGFSALHFVNLCRIILFLRVILVDIQKTLDCYNFVTNFVLY